MKPFLLFILIFVAFSFDLQGVQIRISCSCESDIFHSSLEEDELITQFKIHRSSLKALFGLPPSIQCQAHTSHLTCPQKAIPFEADSVLAGVIHGTNAKATALTSVASIFSISSCILGLHHIFHAIDKKKDAKKLLLSINAKLAELYIQRDQVQDDSIEKSILEEQITFYTQVKEKIVFYLRHEDYSLALNTAISLGTFAEFLGFITSESMFGHENLSPDLTKVSHYFLAGGLLVVSASSFSQALIEFYNLRRKKPSKIPGFANDIIFVSNAIKQSVVGRIDTNKFKTQINQELNQPSSNQVSKNQFEQYLFGKYKKAIRKRASQHKTLAIIKIVGETLIGCGTAFFAASQFRYIDNETETSATSNYLAGAATSIGICLSCFGHWFENKYIRVPPIMYSLHDEEIEMLRLEIMSLLLKLDLTPPVRNNFASLYEYFKKLVPVDDFSKKHGTTEQVTFLNTSWEGMNNYQINMKLFELFYKKDCLHTLGESLLKTILPHPFEYDGSLNPFVVLNHNKTSGIINWHLITEYAFLEEVDTEDLRDKKEQAKTILHEIYREGIKLTILKLQEELKVSIDAYMRLLRRKTN